MRRRSPSVPFLFTKPTWQGVIGLVNRATASRLGKAGIAIPVAAALLWVGTKAASGAPARSEDFMPHGYCYMWNPWIVWLHVISDGLITLSYYWIPLVLIYFIRKNRDIPFNRVFWMFGTFILACGTTHLMEIWNVWHGSYVLAGAVKAVTAAASLLTAAMLIPLVPKVISVPGRMYMQEENRKLEQEIVARNSGRKLAQALAESEEQYRMLLDGIQDYAIFMMDPQGGIVSWNAGAERIKGYKADEIVGRNFSCFFPAGEIERGRPEEILRVTAASGRHEEQGVRVRKDGSHFLASVTFTALRDPVGNLRGFSEISHDLSKRKDSEARYRGLLEAAPDAMVVVNVAGEIVLLNVQAEKQFGYSRDELVGQKVKNIIPEGFAERIIADGTRSAAEALAQQIGTGIELLGRRKDGSEFP